MNKILDALDQHPDRDYSVLFEFILSAKHTNEMERKLILFIRDYHKESGRWPSREYLGAEFGFEPPVKMAAMTPSDLLHWFQRREVARRKMALAEALSEASTGILSDEDPAQFEKVLKEGFQAVSQVGVPVVLDSIRDVSLTDMLKTDRGKDRNLYEFGVSDVDGLVTGMEPGTCVIIAGYPGNFKSQTCVSVAVKNLQKGRGSAILTLEVPREFIKMQALSNYSYSPAWQGEPIPFLSVMKRTLTDASMEEFIRLEAQFNHLDATLYTLGSDNFTAGIMDGIVPAMEYLADQGLQAFFVDHIQLLQYYAPQEKGVDIVNLMVKKMTDTSESLAGRGYNFRVILLSQINRESFKKASRRGGKYDLSCLHQHNELERSASYVVCNFASDELKALNEMRMQLIKNRFGMTMEEPVAVAVDPAYSVVGGITAMEQFDPNRDSISGLLGDDFDI